MPPDGSSAGGRAVDSGADGKADVNRAKGGRGRSGRPRGSGRAAQRAGDAGTGATATAVPNGHQLRWLRGGLSQPGGKLSLFDADGRRIGAPTVRACIEAGWAEPWFANPVKPDWLVCKLTETGRAVVLAHSQTAGTP